MTKEELRNKLAQMSEDLLKILKEYMAEHAKMKGDPGWSEWIAVNASTNQDYMSFSVYEAEKCGKYETRRHTSECRFDDGWEVR